MRSESEYPSPRGDLLQHFCRGLEAGTVRAGSIGRDRDRIHLGYGASGFTRLEKAHEKSKKEERTTP